MVFFSEEGEYFSLIRSRFIERMRSQGLCGEGAVAAGGRGKGRREQPQRSFVHLFSRRSVHISLTMIVTIT